MATLSAVLAAAVLPVVGAPASAAPTAGVTPPTVTAASSRTGTATTLSGMSVSDPDPTQELQVEVSTTLGTLTLPTTAGLTLGFGNSWSGTTSVSFSGVEGSVNAALADARLVGGGTPGVAGIGITSMHKNAGYVYSAPNQHFYEYVPAAGISWSAARTAARARTYKGQQGYLATMPDQQLNDFVSERIQGARNVWFGAHSVANPVTGVARRWRWSDGPLAAVAFTDCSNAAGTCTVVNAAGRYSSWASGEPNNSGSGETAAVSNWNGTSGRWNDLAPAGSASIGGYVVEYGDLATGSTAAFTDFHRASSAVTLADVPATHGAPATQSGDRTLTATLVAPADRGSALTRYVVTATPVAGGSAVTAECTAPAASCTVTGLDNGRAYGVSVVVHNGRGASLPSAATVATPATVPDTPTAVTATALDGAASVGFTAPAWDGGAPVTSYRVSSQPAVPGTPYVSCGGSPCVVPGLGNGTSHTFTVRAVSSAGPSEESAASAPVVPAGPPSPPTDARVEHGDSRATVTFEPPAQTNGAPVTSYSVTVTPAVGGTSYTVTCSGSPCEVPGLTNGRVYGFAVSAVSAGGTSPPQHAGIAVPATVPEAPGPVTATRGDQRIDLSFTAPMSDGGSEVTGYLYSLDAGVTWHGLATSSGPSGLIGTVLGLTNGTGYDVAVRALNAEGMSTATSAGAAAVPATVPDAPVVGGAVPGDGSATVSFSTPASGGEAITSYTVTAQPGGATTTCATSPCRVEGLTNGTAYAFSVVATNGVGDSGASTASDPVVPFARPGAPTALAAVSQDGSALVELTAPASDGGRPVTSYEVSVDGGAWAPLSTATIAGDRLQALLTGLTNGTTHSVRVVAVNLAGPGTPSDAVTVRPAGAPSPPRDVTVELVGRTATVSWTAPAQDGGSPVTGYSVTSLPDGLTCTAVAPARSCQVTGLSTGPAHVFSVVALNGVPELPGTGASTAAVSGGTTVTATPGAPTAASGTPGDRVLVVRWQAPTSPGTSPVEGYEVSLDDGATWSAVAPTGSLELSATLTGVMNGRTYPVRVRAVNADGPGAAVAVRVDEPQWFSDPLTAEQRAGLVAVPRTPARHRGPLRHTTAWGTASDGTPAMSLDRLQGRQLQTGQAASLLDRKMFRFDSPVLTQYGRDQLRAMVASLTYVDAVRCEGHVDHGGRARRAAVLSQKRAATACRVLVTYGADVTTTTQGFGNRVPVVVGGRGHRDRVANRRVVVVVTAG